jgi:two-component system, OmpR family, aerobic respiration control sensor histidine kinase ArcB
MKPKLLAKIKNFLGYKRDEQVPLEVLLEQTVSYYENIISCMPGNVYWIGKEGNAIGCNQNVLDMFGMTSIDEFSGLSFDEMGVIGNWSQEATESFKKDTFDVIRTGKPRLNIEEHPIPNVGNADVYFLTNRVPLLDQNDQVMGVVGISIDITARKKMESELHIEKIKAESANHAKTEFIMNMSHDIRTPLSGVLGMSNLLLEEDLKERTKQYVTWIHESSSQLLNMLTDVLDDVSADNISYLDICLSTFNVRDVVEEIIQLERPSIILKGLELIVNIADDIPELLQSDKVKIHRILLNLVSNSIKFTTKGSVQIIVKRLPTVHEKQIMLQFQVIDTGVGIPENCHAKIFERFYRVTPSYKGLYAGYGLGLHVAQAYAHLLGGNIHFTSELNIGTTFYFDVPMMF